MKTKQVRGKAKAAGTAIEVRGSRVHNLKAIDVSLPHGEVIVVTGPSGCGKSSLAIDTVFAEGQRQYIETLSAFTRQYLDQMPAADVDAIDGLLPTVKIDQHSTAVGPRSTVGTITEIHDFLRVLFARVGEVSCYQCGAAIGQQTSEDIQRWIERQPEGTKLMVLAPMVRGRKGKHLEVLEQIRTERLVRVRLNGELLDIENIPPLDSRRAHTIEAVTDRIVVRPGNEDRLRESIDLAIRLTGRLVGVSLQTSPGPNGELGWSERLFSTDYACPHCEISYPEIEPRTFSFNSPHGACGECQGLGVTEQFDLERLVPDRRKSLAGGALIAWRFLGKKQLQKRFDSLEPMFKKLSITSDTPLEKLSAKAWQTLWAGGTEKESGLLQAVESEWATAIDPRIYETLEQARLALPCKTCNGTRLGATARAVRLGGLNIGEVAQRSLTDVNDWLNGLSDEIKGQPQAEVVIEEINHRLHFLDQVGVSYLTLDRAGPTLSGGELQRVRLAAAIGTGLTNVCFVLDEPSIGLHPRDSLRLIGAISALRDGGNTVLVVEHDEAVMRAADRLIDMGPGAGPLGGEVVAVGSPAEVAASGSLTGEYLSGRNKIETPTERRKLNERKLKLTQASGHNLNKIDVEIPLGLLVAVTGVSGSGKSTLINHTLAPAICNALYQTRRAVEPFGELSGIEWLDKFVEVDQRPIGRNSRSCPATYTGVLDEIRQVYSWTKGAKQAGFGPGRFSFNSGPGRCSECQGLGVRKLTMKFLPDVTVTCGTCDGRRYNDQTLNIRYRDHSIADVLEMPMCRAAEVFADFPKINRVLRTLEDVGLGYLSLGQSAITLSGGEAQRVKLATELASRETGSCLYLLDEPTTGLHLDDVRRLLDVLQRLVDRGNTVVVIEHHLDVIKTADWVIDLGPEGGAAGGRLLCVGSPEEVARSPHSQTGKFLREVLEI
ncbi:MAG: excinuclease ABC subunit UvrA [Pirellulaceae bacterium]|nr:excinuclease ABC subunit UvrA [Pirellulaceae bacterium]